MLGDVQPPIVQCAASHCRSFLPYLGVRGVRTARRAAGLGLCGHCPGQGDTFAGWPPDSLAPDNGLPASSGGTSLNSSLTADDLGPGHGGGRPQAERHVFQIRSMCRNRRSAERRKQRCGLAGRGAGSRFRPHGKERCPRWALRDRRMIAQQRPSARAGRSQQRSIRPGRFQADLVPGADR